MHHARPWLARGRQQTTRLFRQVDHDRARFEHGQIIVPAIDDHWNPPIGVQAQERIGPLIAGQDVDRVNAIIQPQFLERASIAQGTSSSACSAALKNCCRIAARQQSHATDYLAAIARAATIAERIE